VTFDPKRIGETTFAHQLATAFLFTSPVIHFADDPRRYLEAPAPVVEMIKACPAVWDETIVQPGTEIGESAIYARRRGETWFVAGINGNAKEAKDVTLELRFLADGRKYRLDLVADDAASATAFSTTTRTAEKDARVPVSMRPGGGFVARLTPENQ
jgi:alpha-glucosidase